mmetsp:Transcript_9827/g.28859  ORF Transcript_9827/g.28859 Transcript_9827/m.28859 type:complete len:249 (-) Transcript_9827:393-1139(-)
MEHVAQDRADAHADAATSDVSMKISNWKFTRRSDPALARTSTVSVDPDCWNWSPDAAPRSTSWKPGRRFGDTNTADGATSAGSQTQETVTSTASGELPARLTAPAALTPTASSSAEAKVKRSPGEIHDTSARPSAHTVPSPKATRTPKARLRPAAPTRLMAVAPLDARERVSAVGCTGVSVTLTSTGDADTTPAHVAVMLAAPAARGCATAEAMATTDGAEEEKDVADVTVTVDPSVRVAVAARLARW